MSFARIVASILGVTLAVFLAARAAAQTKQPSARTPERTTIFVPAMNGFEKQLIAAFTAQEVPIDAVTEQAVSDLRVRPTFPNSLPSMEVVLYKKETGHAPFSFLDVVDAKTNRTILTYPFLWTDDQVTRSRDAREFAAELKKKLSSKRAGR
jgi:hypothetical protein